MKKCFFLFFLFMTFTMAVMAQNKRIAVVETIDKEQNIPQSITMMVRSNLTKVISGVSGFEGDSINMAEITETHGLDSLMEEERIRFIGEITNADYLLFSEVVKYNETSVFVTAKILNAKTAMTEGSENALMGMTSQNIRHGCESMIMRLLLLTKRFDSKPQTPKNNIGELFIFPDGTKGVVFYLDENGRGLAVSLNESEEVWDNSANFKDIDSLYNVENGETYFNYVEGQRNSQLILSRLGNHAQAAHWCKLQGEGWYLPSCGELFVLMQVVDEIPMFSEALRSAVGGEIDGWYWSSTERNDEEAWNVNSSSRSSSEDKEERIKVRAIRSFTIK